MSAGKELTPSLITAWRRPPVVPTAVASVNACKAELLGMRLAYELEANWISDCGAG